MRSERTATCTSGDPVSPVLVAKLLMTSALRAGVIDIGFPFLIEGWAGGLAGMSSSAVARNSGAGTFARAPARYRKRLLGSRHDVLSNENISRIFDIAGTEEDRAGGRKGLTFTSICSPSGRCSPG